MQSVIVTGFGIFVGHEDRNASWEAVKLLDDNIKVNEITYLLKKIEVPVVYESVDEVIEEIWKEKPILVIHVGVHGRIKTINLEHCAYTSGYCRPDYDMKKLECERVNLKNNADTSCCKISTKLDIEKIARTLNNVSSLEDIDQNCSRYMCSENVGSYLCGYIYLKSLDIDPSRSLFVHVPPIDRPFSSAETSTSIGQIIEKCLEQIQLKANVAEKTTE